MNSFLNKTIKRILNERLYLKLTPSIINDLKIINGDFSFTLYNLGLYYSSKNARLLSFNHHNYTIYHLIENGNVLLRWIDFITKKGILRKVNEISILFKKLKNRNKEINQIDLKYNFKRLIETSKTHLKDLNIGVIDLETYMINNSGEQAIYAAGWSANNEVFTYYLDHERCKTSI